MPWTLKPPGRSKAPTNRAPIDQANDAISNSVNCPVCECITGLSMPAVVDGFIVDRIGPPAPTNVRSWFCERCEHLFITPFPSSDQLASVYRGYRGPEYTEARLKVDPAYQTYADQFNDKDSIYYTTRKSFYDSFLSDLRGFTGKVIDFGGGDGEFTKYVMPSADILVVEESFEREGGDLRSAIQSANLIFCAHVFEHLPEPFEALRQLTNEAKTGTRLWVELPVEYTGSLRDNFNRLKLRADSGDGTLDSPLQVMHEHVAHFSKHSAMTLVSRCGFIVDEIIQSNVGILGIRAYRPY